MPLFSHKGIKLFYQETGTGLPFIFQHGLGADVKQPFSVFLPPEGIRMAAFDARGHGLSETGPIAEISLGSSSEDLSALLDHLQIPAAVIGGISMGAAVALHFALRFPEKVLGLVLSRPAWLDGPNPFNVQMFGLISDLILTEGPEEGLLIFQDLPEFASLKRDFPNTALSLSNQFRHPRARELAANLKRIPADSPVSSPADFSRIEVPTLVLANRKDPIHPYEYGVESARRIPGAEFREVASKSEDVQAHLRQVQETIQEFLITHFCKTQQLC